MKRMVKRNEWLQRIAKYKNSDLSINAWCNKHGIKSSNFYYWFNKLLGGYGISGIYLAIGATDLRKAINGLSVIFFSYILNDLRKASFSDLIK